MVSIHFLKRMKIGAYNMTNHERKALYVKFRAVMSFKVRKTGIEVEREIKIRIICGQ